MTKVTSDMAMAAGDGDVAIAGGAATVNQYLVAGERLFEGVGNVTLERLDVSSNHGVR